MMPTRQLKEMEYRPLNPNIHIHPGKHELESDSRCPHCNFRLAEETPAAGSASKVRRDLDENLNALAAGWTRTPPSNLDDPTVKGDVDPLSDTVGREALRKFISGKSLPDPISSAFVKAPRDVLGRLRKVVVTRDNLVAFPAR